MGDQSLGAREEGDRSRCINVSGGAGGERGAAVPGVQRTPTVPAYIVVAECVCLGAQEESD